MLPQGLEYSLAVDAYQGLGSTHEANAAILFSGLSIYVAHFFEQQRFALWRSDRDLRSTKKLAERNEEKYRGVVENLTEAVI